MTVLDGRTALVTGGAGYLGQAICLALAESGAHVLVNARKAAPCEEFVATLTARGLSASPAIFDVTDPAAVDAFLEEHLNETPLHILVNNASSGRGGTVETATDSDYVNAYDIAVIAAQRLIRGFLPAMREARRKDGDAAIINIASMYGLVSPNLRNYDSAEGSNPPFYGAAKAGLIQLTRYAACQFAPEGIRCNAITPGPFPNPQTQQELPDMVARLVCRVPMGRIGNAAEIAGPVIFLASPAASYITGAVIPVDGGWTAW